MVCIDGGSGGGSSGGDGGGSYPGDGPGGGSGPGGEELDTCPPGNPNPGSNCYVEIPSDSEAFPIWDIVDWASAGISLKKFIQDPTWENLGWLVVDTGGALMPVLPALGTVRNGGELIQSATEALRKAAIFVDTPKGAVVPVPKGMAARVADNGEGIVFQKPGSTGNANMVRIMDPTSRYPDGYVVFYNKGGQPLDALGNPWRIVDGKKVQYKAGDPEIHHGFGGEPPTAYKDWFNSY